MKINISFYMFTNKIYKKIDSKYCLEIFFNTYFNLFPASYIQRKYKSNHVLLK